MPIVVGFRLDGELPPGATATDLVLYVTEMLRAHGVVGKFVEFHGPGLSRLGLADRATISNMSPEFGATATMFPIDDETLRYLRMTGRPDEVIARVEAYAKVQGLFRTDDSREPAFSESLNLDLSTVVPSLAGPRRPQDRVALSDLRDSFRAAFPDGLHAHADGTMHEHAATDDHAAPGTLDEASDESFPASDPPSYTRDPEAERHASPDAPRHEPERLPADAHYRAGEYGACLEQAWRLLGHDPCREDAHRVVMRCHVQRGERAAALRHYQICAHILYTEFDAAPEPATTALFDQIRHQPSQV